MPNIKMSVAKQGKTWEEIYSPEQLIKMKLMRKNQQGSNAPNWKGGRKIENGYVFLFMPSHPNVDHKGYIPEQRYKAVQALGRPLKKGEIIHHINGNKSDNRNSNLLICTKKYHIALHHKMSLFYMQEHF